MGVKSCGIGSGLADCRTVLLLPRFNKEGDPNKSRSYKNISFYIIRGEPQVSYVQAGLF